MSAKCDIREDNTQTRLRAINHVGKAREDWDVFDAWTHLRE